MQPIDECVLPDIDILKNHRQCTLLKPDQLYNPDAENHWKVKFSEKITQFENQKKYIEEVYKWKVKVIYECQFRKLM